MSHKPPSMFWKQEYPSRLPSPNLDHHHAVFQMDTNSIMNPSNPSTPSGLYSNHPILFKNEEKRFSSVAQVQGCEFNPRYKKKEKINKYGQQKYKSQHQYSRNPTN